MLPVGNYLVWEGGLHGDLHKMIAGVGVGGWSKPEVPNHWAADWYRSVGQLVPGHTERINNLYYFCSIYYLILNDVCCIDLRWLLFIYEGRIVRKI